MLTLLVNNRSLLENENLDLITRQFMQVIDKILAYHTLGVCQKVLLSFTSHACQLLTPLFHFTYLPLIGKTHEADKEFKEQFIFFV